MPRLLVLLGLGPRYADRVNTTNFESSASWLEPDWPAIAGVQALFTCRQGGRSSAPWDSMNLGDHVGDDPWPVAANRQLLADVIAQRCGQAVRPVFMQQVHGWDVQVLDREAIEAQAFDACVSDSQEVACTIMVADCLPVLIAHQSGVVVGAAHAGWRGLAGAHGYGVLEALWQAYASKLQLHGITENIASHTQVWLGPCIGPSAFEVDDAVRSAFAQSPQTQACFAAHNAQPGKWLADLAQLARLRLRQMGITHVYGNDGAPAWCTVGNPSLFFSHRRDAAVLGTTGRMAACIWKT